MRPFLFVILLLWSLQLSSSVYAQIPDDERAHAEYVEFANGDIRLAGTLLVPSGSRPFPAAVIVHGSGSSDRSNPWTSAYADALVERGIAVLYPDKRGSGESGGDWRDASFLELAEDAVAAIDVLSANSNVDASRVGLIGFSQGGHIIPVAASRAPSVAFVINVSGSVVPMMEQIGDELRLMAEREGLTKNEVAAIQSIHERAVHFVSTGGGWRAYADGLAEAKTGHLGETEVIKGFPTEPDSPGWTYLRTIGDFDPLPYWRDVDVPALFLYGGRDENVDVYKSADVIEESLTPDGLAYSLLLFRENGHALYREDAMDFIARWIRDGGVD
jgi:hypothetical protein